MSLKYSNPTTSFQAAVDNLPRAGTQRRLILDTIRSSGGLTRDEIEVLTDLSGNAVRPRIRELQEEGHVEETKETRRTRSGSMAAVLVATNAGSSTEGRDQAGTSIPQPVDTTSGVASGVEAAVPSTPPPEEHNAAPPENPYQYEVWAA